MTSPQKIGLFTAIIVGMNAMIGSGIFTIPTFLALQAGPAGIITTLFVALIAWSMALSLAKVAQFFPGEGSFYHYVRQWGGHTLGMIASASYLIGLFIAMGLLAKMAGVYIQHHIHFLDAQTLGFMTLVLLTIVNMLGVAMSEMGQYILIVCTVFPLIITSILCFTKASSTNLKPFAPYGVGSIFSASKTVIFAFFGFESAASLFSIVKDPERNVPRAVSYSLCIVGIIYLLFASSIICAIPMASLSDPLARLTSMLSGLFPSSPWLISIINISIVSAIVGTIHSMIWGSSQLVIALCKTMRNSTMQALVQRGTINTTTAALFVGCCILSSFFLLEKISLFFSLTALFIVFAYATSIMTLLVAPTKASTKDRIIACIALCTSGLITYYALSDIAMELLKLR